MLKSAFHLEQLGDRVLHRSISQKFAGRLASAVAILPMACVLVVGSACAQMSVDCKGEIDLPVSLYTGDGIQLVKGRFDIEIRSEKGLDFLVFLQKGEIISLVNGQSIGGHVMADNLPDQPMLGTVYLYSVGTSHEPEKDEKSSVTFMEHLKNRPWKAALRVYRYSAPQNREVAFILEEESKPGEWSRTDFKLFLKK